MKVHVAQNSNKTQFCISAKGKWRMRCELLGIHEDQKSFMLNQVSQVMPRKSCVSPGNLCEHKGKMTLSNKTSERCKSYNPIFVEYAKLSSLWI